MFLLKKLVFILSFLCLLNFLLKGNNNKEIVNQLEQKSQTKSLDEMLNFCMTNLYDPNTFNIIDSIVKSDNNNIRALYIRAMVLKELAYVGDRKKKINAEERDKSLILAWLDIQKVIELNPENIFIYNYATLYYLSLVQYAESNFKKNKLLNEALKYCDASINLIKIPPYNYNNTEKAMLIKAYDNKGVLYEMLDIPDKKLYWKKACELGPYIIESDNWFSYNYQKYEKLFGESRKSKFCYLFK